MKKVKKYYLPVINLQKIETEDILSASSLKTDEILDITADSGINEKL